MASVASQLIEEVTAHVEGDSLEDVREICADGTYFPNKLRISFQFCFFPTCLFYIHSSYILCECLNLTSYQSDCACMKGSNSSPPSKLKL